MSLNPKKNKDFSIIIPTYNRSSFVRQAIMSALRQKNVSMEIIVSDDCSTDDTAKVVKAFKDKRIKYIRNKERLGSSLNFQKSFLRASGDYIFTLGDDDFILEENTLFEVLKIMRKYKVGMGRIGAISYEKSPEYPYKVVILSSKLLVVKPDKIKNILAKSIGFALGFYSGLIFNNLLLDKKKLKMDHVCYSNHMCQLYHPASYDLIQKYGIAYIPNHFIVSRLSLQMIPTYFNIEKHGRLFMEEPIILTKGFIQGKDYEEYKRAYLRNEMILLPNIKYFSNNRNYTEVLQRMISLDNTLLTHPKFILLALSGFMPKFIIKVLRDFMIYYSDRNIKEIVKKYNYFQKIKKFGIQNS